MAATKSRLLHDAQDGYFSDSESLRNAYNPNAEHPISTTFLQRLRSALIRKPLITLTIGAFLILVPTFLRAQRQPHSYTTATIQNRTLGFQKIYAMGLPTKYHKHDNLLLAGLQTDLDITFEPSVPWKDVPESEWPDSDIEAVKGHGAGLVGAWRVHMNVMEHIVQENIQTALILEDDADWDVTIKAQMSAFAEGLVALQKDLGVSDTTYVSPYGDGWDLLWTGACLVQHTKLDDKYFLFENDTTAAAPWHQSWAGQNLPVAVYDKNKRAIFRTGYSMCVAGFAITNAAARKILARMALSNFKDAEDTEYGRMCEGSDHDLDARGSSSKLECYAAWPPYHGSHRFAGLNSADSDVWAQNEGWHDEHAVNIVYSASLNIPRYQWGNTTVKAQWEDCDVQFIDRTIPPTFHGSIVEHPLPT